MSALPPGNLPPHDPNDDDDGGRIMSAIGIAIVAIAVLYAFIGPAYPDTITATRCASNGSATVCRTTTTREPMTTRGPVTREDVVIAGPTRPVVAVEPQRTDNFCGPGFRMTRDGCSPK